MTRLITFFASVAIVVGLGACCCPCGPVFRGGGPPIVVNPPPIVVQDGKRDDNRPQDGNRPKDDNRPQDGKGKPPVQDPLEEKLKKLNAAVKRDEGLADRPIIEVKFHFPPQWQDRDLKELAALPQLRKLELGQNQNANGSGFKDLTGLQNLEYLDTSGMRVSDEALKHIANLKGLKVFKAVLQNVSPAGLKDIAKLDQLEELGATNARNDKAIKEFAKLTNLRRLQIDNSDFGDESAKAISALPELKILDAYGSRVTDAGMVELAKLPQLEELRIGYSFGDKGVDAFAGNTKLRVLSIWNATNVTDASIQTLVSLKDLRELEIGAGNRFTPKGRSQLMKAFNKRLKVK